MPDGVAAPVSGIAGEALAGLLGPTKRLPAKLFYDTEGCRLFGLITELPEYYLTRTEMALLREHAHAIAALVAPGAVVVEYGAGSETKAALVLATLARPSAYVPIDVAAVELREGAERLGRRFPALRIVPVVGDFLRPIRVPEAAGPGPRLGFFPGSTIGNLEPRDAVGFLESARAMLGPGAQFLIGADRRKSPEILLPAYDDSRGVTAAFNRNILTHLNRAAGADFEPSRFAHRAVWNDAESRIEMHLVSQSDQVVRLAGTEVFFREGESIHTESSYKHSPERLIGLAGEAGWHLAESWTDPDRLFSLYLFDAAP